MNSTPNAEIEKSLKDVMLHAKFIKQHMDAGNKIEAIKEFRSLTGMHLAHCAHVISVWMGK